MVLGKIILEVLSTWSSEAALNFIYVIDISGWLCSLQFLSVTLPVMDKQADFNKLNTLIKNTDWVKLIIEADSTNHAAENFHLLF